MSQYWFKPKRYGLGAAPSSWEGWALTLAYVAAVIGAGTLLVPAHTDRLPVAFLAVAGALTILFCGVCWAKTEGGWHWRWGDDDRR